MSDNLATIPIEQLEKISKVDFDVSKGGKGAQQLQAAFRAFMQASERFEKQYACLEDRVAELNLELEEANTRLTRNLRQKELMQDYLSTLLETLPVGVLGLDQHHQIRSCNEKGCEILGFQSDAILGKRLDSFFKNAPEKVALLLSGDESVEVEHDRPDCARRRVLKLRSTHTRGGDQRTAGSEAAPKAARKNRKNERNATARLVLDQAGQIEASRVLLVEDVTDVRRLEQQANRNDRLAAMGEIAMNVAHEIRNPLGSIELFASMLQRSLEEDQQNGELARHICTGVRCVDNIVGNILQFSRPQRLVCSSFDLQELLDETLVFAEHALRQKDITIHRDFGQGDTFLYADAELLKQMFLNLFLNACHATPENGHIGVQTIPNGTTVEIRVWDSGAGLDQAIIKRIFDPFFTTRRKGTGLGLTIVHNIISVHQGSIEADNRTEGGALFTIVLPKKAPQMLDGKELPPASLTA